MTANGYLPVVACVAGDRQGQVYNVNADQMAVACAAAFGARQLIFLTDVEGVLDGAKQVRPLLTAADSRQLIADGVATGGMQAKLNAALSALARRRGTGADRARAPPTASWTAFSPAKRSAPTDGDRMISSLQADALSESPPASPRLTVRKAVMRDIAPILELINGYAANGIMLPRTEFEMSEAIRDFTVVTLDGQLLGCGALHFYSPTTAEIRSLAVHEHAKTHGVGRKLVEASGRGSRAVRTRRRLRFHLRCGFFQQSGLSRGRTRSPAAQGVEGLRALPQVPGLRRNCRIADSSARSLGSIGAAALGSVMTSPTDELIQIPTPRKL